MEIPVCIYCDQPSVYACSCLNPFPTFCRSHISTHLSSSLSHVLTLIQVEEKQINSSSKGTILNKIHELLDESSETQKFIIKSVSDIISKTIKQANETLRKLRNFNNACNDLITEILNLKTIPKKGFYNPLESALLSENPIDLLSKFNSPKVILNLASDSFFAYKPSLLFYCLYNYSDVTLSIDKNKLLWYPQKKEILNENFYETRFLPIEKHKILITGGVLSNKNLSGQNAFVLDLNTEKLTTLKNLLYKRLYHAMC